MLVDAAPAMRATRARQLLPKHSWLPRTGVVFYACDALALHTHGVCHSLPNGFPGLDMRRTPHLGRSAHHTRQTNSAVSRVNCYFAGNSRTFRVGVLFWQTLPARANVTPAETKAG